MSRQLNRIRNLVSDIEEIQKNGQQSRGGFISPMLPPLLSTPEPMTPMAEPITEMKAEPRVEWPPAEPKVEALRPVIAEPPSREEKQSPPVVVPLTTVSNSVSDQAPPVSEPGRIVMQLSGSIMVALEIDGTHEVLEIRRMPPPLNCIEIRFADGKAVHLPLKDVA